jgi:RNA polymerase sigma factor (sigma-70 family)
MDTSRIDALARASGQGDREAFHELVEVLTRPLLAAAYRYTRDWEAARDLTQDTWIKVWEHLGRYDPARSFRSWLLTVHRNHCLSHLRRASVRCELATEDALLERAAPADPAPDPLVVAGRIEFDALLRSALARLPESQLQVFTRVDLEQSDQAEAARELGMKFSTLRVTLHFARRRLAGLLREMGAEP